MGLTGKTAVEIGRMIDSGSVDPVEVAEHFLDAIEQSDLGPQIFARTTRERAIREALRARERARSGTRRSLLDGVPVSWKDLFDTEGVATESGAALLRGSTPHRDAHVLELAGAAGTVCLGKTHQTEFAFSGLGINPNTATPPNLDFPGCTPGGSSSGAAASIRYGMAPIAIGSDTGGSVRIPACWNSLVGFKTTHGLISLEGVVPLCPGFDTVGPLAQSVEDAAVMTEIMAGGDLETPLERALGDCHFAIPEGESFADCDIAQIEGFESAVRMLEKAGARISRIEAPYFHSTVTLGPVLFPYEAWHSWGELIDANPGVTYGPVEERFRQGSVIAREVYLKAKATLEDMRRKHEASILDYDALLTPTLAITPKSVDELLADGALFNSTNLMALRNTRYVNLSGGCALTLPTQINGAGLQIIGSAYEDAKILGIGLAAERALNFG